MGDQAAVFANRVRIHPASAPAAAISKAPETERNSTEPKNSRVVTYKPNNQIKAAAANVWLISLFPQNQRL